MVDPSRPHIGAADMMLGPDHSVFHLGIPYGVLPDTIITVGDQERVPMVSARFDAVTHAFGKREFITHIGRLGGKEVAVVSTGIGTDNIDIVLHELDFLVNYNPATREPREKKRTLHIVRIGTTGGLHPEAVPDSFVLSHGATGFDALMHYYAIPDKRAGSLFMDEEMAAAIGLSFTPYTVHAGWPMLAAGLRGLALAGHTATCAGFYGPQGRRTRTALRIDLLSALASAPLRQGLPFTNFEMETAGIFALSCLLGHQAASVSLVVANRVTGQISADPGMAMDELIDLVLGAV